MRFITTFTLPILGFLSLLSMTPGCSHEKNYWRSDKAGTGHTHVVEKGDTLFGLSKQYGVSIDEIAQANSLDRNAPLRIGQPIYLPRVNSPDLARTARDRITESDNATILLGWPVEKGVLFRTFDETPTRLHEGLSIGAPANTPVEAAQDGEIIFAADANNHFGKMIIIKHDEPFVSIYAHLDVINVAVGKKVRKGEIIGTVGSTGGVESPRVYFQLRKNRMPVNPEPYLSKPG